MTLLPLLLVLVPLAASVVVRLPGLDRRRHALSLAAAAASVLLGGAVVLARARASGRIDGLPWMLTEWGTVGAEPWLVLVAALAVLIDRETARQRGGAAAEASVVLASLGMLAGFLLADEVPAIVAFGLLTGVVAARRSAGACVAGLVGDLGLLAAVALQLGGHDVGPAVAVAAAGRLLRPALERRPRTADALDAVAGIALLLGAGAALFGEEATPVLAAIGAGLALGGAALGRSRPGRARAYLAVSYAGLAVLAGSMFIVITPLHVLNQPVAPGVVAAGVLAVLAEMRRHARPDPEEPGRPWSWHVRALAMLDRTAAGVGRRASGSLEDLSRGANHLTGSRAGFVGWAALTAGIAAALALLGGI